ncbi:ABC transporter permease [soil metagenome]
MNRGKDPGDRLFTLLLRFYPAEFRHRLEREMLELFAERRAAARTTGARAQLWTLILWDTGVTILHERRPHPRRNMEESMQDIRHAWRALRRTPAVPLLIVLLMSVGIGSTTAVFSIVDGVRLRPFPFRDPERIVLAWEQRLAVARNTVAGHEYPEWKARSRSFSSLAAIAFDRDFTLTGTGEPASLNGVRVTSDFFKVMGVQPVEGGVFGGDADIPGHGEVVVLSHRLWKERFAGDPGIIGRAIQLNDVPHLVAAVMPAGFEFPAGGDGEPPDLWTPIAEPIYQYRGRHYLFVVGRLADGVTPAQAQTELAGIAAGVAAEFPPNRDHSVNVQPIESELVADSRKAILVLFAAVAIVLLVACCNVANLLLARARERRQEIAIREALGAGRWRIARQLLAEAAILSLASGCVGLALAQWLVNIARTTVPAAVPRIATASLDGVVIGFAACLTLATTAIFGLLPLSSTCGVDAAERLKSGAKGAPRGTGHPLQNLLIVAEVALTVALAIGSGLLFQSFARLHAVDPGFSPNGVVAMDLRLPEARYPGASQRGRFFQELVDRVTADPGMQLVAATNMVPQGGGRSGVPIAIPGRPSRPAGDELLAQYRVVTAAYFRTLGIPTLRGRTFDENDARRAVPLIRWFDRQPLPPHFAEPQPAPAAVVNDTMAREMWPGEDPLDRAFRILFSPPITVVGVVADARNSALSERQVAEFYLSDLQEPQQRMTILLRSGSSDGGVSAARRHVAALDPQLPVSHVRSLESVVDGNLALHRFTSSVILAFAAVTLLLMVAGVYAVISYATTQRTHELGVRIALGATHSDIGRLIVFKGLALCAAGAAVGMAGGYALARTAGTMLYEIEPADPMTYSVLVALVLGVATLAAWLPARRAMQVDPASVLRNG